MSTAPAQSQSDWTVADGYEEVATAFLNNFALEDEVGASFAAYRDGELVVDIWAGDADTSAAKPWQADSLQVIFSGSKGLVATCLLLLLDRGLLDLDRPVRDYWPEFGKERIRVHHIVSHSAGLPAFKRPVLLDEITDDVRMASLLAEQSVFDDPRADCCYHPLTYGWLAGELIRRIDGRSVGQFFADEIAEPLELELWIGLPAGEEARVTFIEQGPGWEADVEAAASDQLAMAVFANPLLFDPPTFPWNGGDFHAAEIPGAGAIGTSRSIARLYGCLAQGGKIDGVRLCTSAALRAGLREISRRYDPLLNMPMAFATGFQLQTELTPYGPPRDAFGHGGAGGSCHGAWPTQRVGYSYSMNRMVAGEDNRSRRILESLYRAVVA